MKKNKFQPYLILVLIPCVFFIISFSSLFSYLYDINYYDKGYAKYNIYQRFTKEKAMNATENILGYFKSENMLDDVFFNKDEISHLYDVKVIIGKINAIYIASLIAFWAALSLSYITLKEKFPGFFSSILLYSGLASLALMLSSVAAYLFSGFDFLFLKFHELFFTGNYMFDPRVSNMKALFPDAFFFDMASAIAAAIIIKSLLISASGYILRERFQKKNNKKIN